MKKLILLLVISISIISANTQTIILKIGPSISKMNWDNSISNIDGFYSKNYTGFQTFIGINYLQKQFFELNSGIGYIKAGGDGSIETISVNNPEGGSRIIETKTELNIFSINTTANFKFTINKKITLLFGIGSRLDYLVSYNEKLAVLKRFDVNKFLFGIIGRVGINYELKKFSFGIDFNYNFNITKLVKQVSPDNISNEITYKFYSVLFCIGYKLK